MTNQFRNPNDEWRRTAKRRSRPAVSSLKPPASSLPLKRRGKNQDRVSPEIPGKNQGLAGTLGAGGFVGGRGASWESGQGLGRKAAGPPEAPWLPAG